MKIVLVVLYIICAVLNGVSGGIKFSDDEYVSGWMHIFLAVLWSACAALAIANL